MISLDFPSIQNYGIDTLPKERPTVHCCGVLLVAFSVQKNGGWSQPTIILNLYSSLYRDAMLASMQSVEQVRASNSTVTTFANTLLQERATFAPFVLSDLQGSPGGHFKHFPHSILCLGGAFKVAKSIDSVRHVSAIFRLHRLLRKNDDKQNSLIII